MECDTAGWEEFLAPQRIGEALPFTWSELCSYLYNKVAWVTRNSFVCIYSAGEHQKVNGLYGMDQYMCRRAVGENTSFHVEVFATSPAHAEAACRFLLGLLRTSNVPTVYLSAQGCNDSNRRVLSSALVTMFLTHTRQTPSTCSTREPRSLGVDRGSCQSSCNFF